MTREKRFLSWLNDNGDVVIGLLRVYVGFLLLSKGIELIIKGEHGVSYMTMVNPRFFEFFSLQVVALVHVVSGFFMALGLLTRLSALVQTIVILAVLFSASSHVIMHAQVQNHDFVTLMLCILVFFTLYGGGKISIDYVLRKKINKQQEKK